MSLKAIHIVFIVASIVLALVLWAPLIARAQTPISYRLTFPAPEHRWMQVELTLTELPAGR